MQHAITMTLQQLSVLRLMLRLVKVKAIRTGLQKFKSNILPEALALAEILQREDTINAIDIGLMLSEHQAVEHNPAPLTPVNLVLEAHQLETVAKVVEMPFSAEGSLGGQAEQAAVLQLIAQEREGLKLAIKTSTTEGQIQAPIFQAMPRGRQ